jgi:hypothetical protein
MIYIIQDWAGNVMNFGEFDSFEDAWSYIYEHFQEDDYQEFYVVERGAA